MTTMSMVSLKLARLSGARIPTAVIAATSWIALMLIVALLAQWISPFEVTAIDLRHRLTPPVGLGGSVLHPLGTDELGRDVASRLLHSIQISLSIAFGATLIASAV